MNREEKVIRLFSAIGEVDDALINEATEWHRAPKHHPFLSRTLPIAASIVLVAGLAMGGILSKLVPLWKDNAAGDSGAPGQSDLVGGDALGSFLTASRATLRYEALSGAAELASSPEAFWKGARLAWQYEGEDTVYLSRRLTKNEVNKLTALSQNGNALPVGEESTLPCKLWILLGDGTVITPYLKSSYGNIGAATLFDYSAELIPSDEFASCVSQILQ